MRLRRRQKDAGDAVMRNPLSDKIVNIQPSGIRKFFDIVNEMKDAISLGVGEPDFDTPWRIREEGIYSLERGRTFYTSNAGLKELKEEIANYLERKIHVSYDPSSEIIVTVGGSEGIDIAMRAMLNPGDEVLIRSQVTSPICVRGACGRSAGGDSSSGEKSVQVDERRAGSENYGSDKDPCASVPK